MRLYIFSRVELYLMNLHLPVLTDPSESSVSPIPRKLKRWLDDLPLVNMGEATRLFYSALQSFNRQHITAKNRLDAMELMRPIARQALEHLAKHFVSVSFPLTGKSRQIEQLSQSLLQEMAIGYKQVINEVEAHNIKLDRKSIQLAIHRAMRYLEKSLQLSAQLYTNSAAYIWHDLHQLYEYAEQQDLTGTTVKDEDYTQLKQSSITEVYKHVCLLALSDPHRLRGGETLKLTRFFETHAGHVEITKSLKPDSSGAMHITSLKSSEPPSYVTLAELNTFNNLRGFDLSALLQQLRNALSSNFVNADASLAELGNLLVEKLIRIWTVHQTRQNNRAPANAHITVAIGIANIADAIYRDTAPNLSVEEILLKQARNVRPARAPIISSSPESPWNTLLQRSPLINETSLPPSEVPKVESPKLPSSWQRWKLLNTSPGGYGLLWDNNTACRAQVGEIIALREKENQQYQWRLGQIRWMKHTAQGALSVGVKMISPRTVIATIIESSRPMKTQHVAEVIMLPGMKSLNQQPSILAVPKQLQVGDELALNLAGRQLHLKLTGIGEKSNNFIQFAYQQLESTNQRENGNFDKLWQKL
jgi:hypothetical protein